MNTTDLAQLLVNLRKSRDLKLSHAAKHGKIDRFTLQCWENGTNLHNIAKFLTFVETTYHVDFVIRRRDRAKHTPTQSPPEDRPKTARSL